MLFILIKNRKEPTIFNSSLPLPAGSSMPQSASRHNSQWKGYYFLGVLAMDFPIFCGVF